MLHPPMLWWRAAGSMLMWWQVLHDAAGAPIVLVVGRESNVLGTAFRNSDLLRRLMRQSGGPFKLDGDSERVFTNRFGQRIYEDVIVGRCVGRASLNLAYARAIGVEALDTAIKLVPDQNRMALNEVAPIAWPGWRRR